MLGGADKSNGDLGTYITGADNSEHIKTGRSHLRRLATMQRHLLDMADAWEDLDNSQITDFNALADRVGESSSELTGLMEEWKNSKEWDGE